MTAFEREYGDAIEDALVRGALKKCEAAVLEADQRGVNLRLSCSGVSIR